MINNKYQVYQIGAIQGIFKARKKNTLLINWRDDITKWSKSKKLPIHFLNPLIMEAEKTGYYASEMCKKLVKWKKQGKWDLYDEYGRKIWYGTHTCWGDYPCIFHSDFIIGYGSNDYISPGTHKELGVAEIYKVPVYWVTPDDIVDIKDSTLMGVRFSGGKVFNSFNELKKFLIKKVGKK